MLTFQDFQEENTTEQRRQAFIKNAISYHKTTELYQRAYAGYKYYCNKNLTIMHYEKWIYTRIGEKIKDYISPNHKCANGMFKEFIRQENECLLANGVNFKEPDTKDQIGGSQFDNVLKKLGKAALWGGVSFGFFNTQDSKNYIRAFTMLDFVPLWDEETGELKAGIYFWQIDESKPLRAILFEIDGYTDYLFNTREEEVRIVEPKRAYKIQVNISETGTEIAGMDNYTALPIVPFWGNPEHESEFTEALQNSIDAYDMILSGFANIIDETSELYWILTQGGMDENDAAEFKDLVRRLRVAFNPNGASILQPETINIPHEAREVALNRLRKEMYTAFGAVDYAEMSISGATATGIAAAYRALNYKVSDYETCVIDFIKGILNLLGIDDEPSFTRDQLVNAGEEIDNVLKSAEHLAPTYVTKKLLTLLGDIDQLDDVLKEISETEVARVEFENDDTGSDTNL